MRHSRGRRSFSSRVGEVIMRSDIVLEALDARFPEETRNHKFEEFVLRNGKKLLFVLNKSDLVPKGWCEREKHRLVKISPCIFLSAKEKSGKYLLKKTILRMASGKGTVGVIGYPNTGKSSIINALSGRKAARTSGSPGFTKGEQRVRLREGLYLIDTPGVIPLEERDEERLLVLNAKSPEQASECAGAAERILGMIARENPKAVIERYGVHSHIEPEKTLEGIAMKLNRRKKGGALDLEATARQVVLDWQRGKIGLR